jgi:hypothetical protein
MTAGRRFSPQNSAETSLSRRGTHECVRHGQNMNRNANRNCRSSPRALVISV